MSNSPHFIWISVLCNVAVSVCVWMYVPFIVGNSLTLSSQVTHKMQSGYCANAIEMHYMNNEHWTSKYMYVYSNIKNFEIRNWGNEWNGKRENQRDSWKCDTLLLVICIRRINGDQFSVLFYSCFGTEMAKKTSKCWTLSGSGFWNVLAVSLRVCVCVCVCVLFGYAFQLWIVNNEQWIKDKLNRTMRMSIIEHCYKSFVRISRTNASPSWASVVQMHVFMRLIFFVFLIFLYKLLLLVLSIVFAI